MGIALNILAEAASQAHSQEVPEEPKTEIEEKPEIPEPKKEQQKKKYI